MTSLGIFFVITSAEVLWMTVNLILDIPMTRPLETCFRLVERQSPHVEKASFNVSIETFTKLSKSREKKHIL